MCEGASKQTPDPKNSTAPGSRPPVLKFLDTPLQCSIGRYENLEVDTEPGAGRHVLLDEVHAVPVEEIEQDPEEVLILQVGLDPVV